MARRRYQTTEIVLDVNVIERTQLPCPGCGKLKWCTNKAQRYHPRCRRRLEEIRVSPLEEAVQHVEFDGRTVPP